MPNTKSAASRARQNLRRQQHNKSVSSRVKTLQKNYEAALAGGKKDEAAKALQAATSAIDKAAKVGVLHRATANRKKSRLSLRMAKIA